VWIDRAFVVNDWYISSYEPILDTTGQRVGMLYAGFLESPFRNALFKGLAVLGFLFLILMLFSAILAVQGAKSIFKPLELMSTVAHATRAGRDQRIGVVNSRDEIGELAREFDAMLDRLKERNQEIQAWAEQLEDKVEERTSELKKRNEELQHTIRVLQETRQQLVVAEKLAALGELTAGVAHEINNPTAVILGNIDVMMEELGEHAEPIREDVQLIIEQIYRIKEIINNLLQYSRPEEFVGYLTEVNVNQVAQRTVALVRHLQKKERFKLELELAATRSIQLNPQELQQVLVNLVVNAVHSFANVAGGKANGVVKIITEDWDDNGVVVHVEDNGSGIEEQQLSRIFNPFFSTKKQGKGTGLGLSVSYGIIRRYGGNITVASQLGKGSRFSIWLLSVPILKDDETTLTEQLQSFEEEASVRA
jgi:two-component system NtrC family sensor kinase